MTYFCTVDNDLHRASKMKQPHANNTKKQKKAKASTHVTTTQEEQSARIFQNMQEEVRDRLTCCAPGAELEVNSCFNKMYK